MIRTVPIPRMGCAAGGSCCSDCSGHTLAGTMGDDGVQSPYDEAANIQGSINIGVPIDLANVATPNLGSSFSGWPLFIGLVFVSALLLNNANGGRR